MYPSSSSGIGIPLSFGLPSSSVHGSGNVAADEACVAGPSFSWLNQYGGQSSGILSGGGDPPPGMKMPTGGSDQMIDRSSYLNSIDSHTASLPRLTPHSIVSSGSSSLTLDTHGQQSDGGSSSMGTFHPYRPGSDGGGGGGGVPIGHPSISRSQYAAFDSIYKAYQNAYGAGSAAAMFGNQPYRYDNSLMAAEHQLMLQASLLQYPHLGIYPNPALYPNLQSGIRYQGDYYLQNLAGLSLLSKYPDITGPSWLGMDRSPAFTNEREKDDRCKEQTDVAKQRSSEKETSSSSLPIDHHKSRHDRGVGGGGGGGGEMRDESSVKRDNNSSARHHSEKDGTRNEQQKRSSSTRSPARHEQRRSDAAYGKFNSGGHGEYAFTSRTHGSGGIIASGIAAGEPLNLQKPLSSPCGTMQQQQQQQPRQTSTRRDRTFEMNQEYLGVKDRHQMSSSKADESRDKRGTTFVPSKSGSSSTTTNSFGQQQQHFKGQFEPKFHRPFEQVQPTTTTMNLNFTNNANEHYDRQQQFGIHGITRDVHQQSNSNSRGSECQDHYSRTNLDYNKSAAHHDKQQQQQLVPRSSSDRKVHSTMLSNVHRKRTSESISQNEELPLNLANTKATGTHFDPSRAMPKERDAGRVRPSGDLLQEPNVDQTVKKKCSSGAVVNSSASSRSGKASKDSTRTKAVEPKPLVSKLDLMIARKKKVTAGGETGEKSDDENDADGLLADDDSLEVAKRLLITSGPSLADDVSSKKMQFLAMFGLISVDVHRDFEYKQQQRSRRQLRESSVSPIQLNKSSMEPALVALLNSTDDQESRYSGYTDCVDKNSMLRLLQLQSVDNSDAERCSEYEDGSSRRLSPDVTRSRRSLKRRMERSNSTTPPTCHKRCHVEDDRVNRTTHEGFVATNESRSLTSSSAKAKHFVDSCNAFDNVGSQRKFACLASDQLGKGRDLKDVKHGTREPGLNRGDVVSTDGRCFVGENLNFAKINRYSSSSTSPFHDLDSDPVYVWPGHEVIIESYYRHMEEQTMEKQLLIEQNNRIHLLNADLIQKSDELRSQVSGLIQTKEQLNDNRCKIQSAIDDLKTCIKFLQ